MCFFFSSWKPKDSLWILICLEGKNLKNWCLTLEYLEIQILTALCNKTEPSQSGEAEDGLAF